MIEEDDMVMINMREKIVIIFKEVIIVNLNFYFGFIIYTKQLELVNVMVPGYRYRVPDYWIPNNEFFGYRVPYQLYYSVLGIPGLPLKVLVI